MGDLNAVESSAALEALAAEVTFVDAFRAAHPEASGFTVYQPVTVPERRARRRVDYVLLVPGRVVPGAVIDSRVVVDAPGRLADGTLLWPSDHYGVLADLSVFPGPDARTAIQQVAPAGPTGARDEPSRDGAPPSPPR
jgi:exonuclease III